MHRNKFRVLLTKFFWPVLALLPFALVLLMVYRYRVDVLFWDEWDFVPTVAKFYQGTLSFSDFWVQHNEHRPLFPELFLLVLVHMSRWNISYELAFNIALVVIVFSLIAYQLRISERVLNISLFWVLPFISLLVFSLAQAENWEWGWQLIFLFSNLAVIAGIVFVNGSASWWKFTLALFLGIVATYSLGNGFLLWVVGVFIISVCLYEDRRLMYSRLAIWVGTAILTMLSYLYDYYTPSYHPSPWLVFEKPGDFAAFVLVSLGMPLAPNSSDCLVHAESCALAAVTSGLASVVGLSLFGALLLALARKVKLQYLAPYIAMAFYALLTALLIGISRFGFGLGQAVTSRYATFFLMFWIALVVLLSMAMQVFTVRSQIFYGLAVVLFALSCLVAWTSWGWQSYFYSWHERLFPVRAELFSLQNDDLLRHITHTPDYVRGLVPVLQKYHLSVYRIP